VQPIVFTYSSPFFSPSHDVMDVLSHIILMTTQFYLTIRVRELPVFEVNDYFFKHYQKENESKWVPFMNCVRQVMSEASEQPLSTQSVEEKLDYKI